MSAPVPSNASFYVYRWRCLENGKQYIGKGMGGRATWHSPGRKSLVSKAMKKHGKHNFTLDYLFQDLTEEEAYHMERLAIDRHQTRAPLGYNLAEGGFGGAAGLSRPWSEKTREKMKAVYQSDDYKARLSQALRKAQTPEVRARKSAAAKAARTEEGAERTRRAHLGSKRSEEARKRMSDSAKNRVHARHRNPITGRWE